MELSMYAQPNSREEDVMSANANSQENVLHHVFRFLALAFVAILAASAPYGACAAVVQEGFSTPKAAVKALIDAIKKNDNEALLRVLSADAEDVVDSGDAVRDQQQRENFLSAYERKNSLVEERGRSVLVIGESNWPFPIPIVKKGNQWFFDASAGREELLNRRIGQNELSTIQTLLAIVDAQREYASQDLNGNGIREYAQSFASNPGEHNGLYWETKEGESPSPLGPLVAAARSYGYEEKQSSDEPSPYYGYHYRILNAQGKHAAGGAYDYVVNGKMIGGFAVVAFPARYGNSGIMTFVVNHDGVVYQKDLGEDTEKSAEEITAFDPDQTWKKAQ